MEKYPKKSHPVPDRPIDVNKVSQVKMRGKLIGSQRCRHFIVNGVSYFLSNLLYYIRLVNHVTNLYPCLLLVMCLILGYVRHDLPMCRTIITTKQDELPWYLRIKKTDSYKETNVIYKYRNIIHPNSPIKIRNPIIKFKSCSQIK